jgi:hypothetical protein
MHSAIDVIPFDLLWARKFKEWTLRSCGPRKGMDYPVDVNWLCKVVDRAEFNCL